MKSDGQTWDHPSHRTYGQAISPCPRGPPDGQPAQSAYPRTDDFKTTPEGGLYLDQSGKRRYFVEYAKELTTRFPVDGQHLSFRDLFRRQAERLATALTRDEPYESFLLPC